MNKRTEREKKGILCGAPRFLIYFVLLKSLNSSIRHRFRNQNKRFLDVSNNFLTSSVRSISLTWAEIIQYLKMSDHSTSWSSHQRTSVHFTCFVLSIKGSVDLYHVSKKGSDVTERWAVRI